jgi:hypothetical protein
VVTRRSCRVGSQSLAQSARVSSPRRGSSQVADISDASISMRRRSASSRRANVSLWPGRRDRSSGFGSERRGAPGPGRHAWRARTAQWRPSVPHLSSRGHASQRSAPHGDGHKSTFEWVVQEAAPVHGMCTRAKKMIMTRLGGSSIRPAQTGVSCGSPDGIRTRATALRGPIRG